MDLAQLIRTAVAIAAPTRTITFDQLNDLVRSDLEPEEIEALLSALSENDIRLIDE